VAAVLRPEVPVAKVGRRPPTAERLAEDIRAGGWLITYEKWRAAAELLLKPAASEGGAMRMTKAHANWLKLRAESDELHRRSEELWAKSQAWQAKPRDERVDDARYVLRWSPIAASMVMKGTLPIVEAMEWACSMEAAIRRDVEKWEAKLGPWDEAYREEAVKFARVLITSGMSLEEIKAEWLRSGFFARDRRDEVEAGKYDSIIRERFERLCVEKGRDATLDELTAELILHPPEGASDE